MHKTETAFGLGYYDGPNGELTHFFWCRPESVQHGPYRVLWMVYHDRAQFLELMALLKGLGDQVYLVTMREPPGIQLQDLIAEPFRQRRTREDSKFEPGIRAVAYAQFRICNLPACLAQTHLWDDSLRFNLPLTDPIEHFLDESSEWGGVAGHYVVTLSPSSGAERGLDATLPTLTASVGAFTRLWLGVRPATSLAMTDELSGPPGLLEQLDRVLRLPEPKPDWDF